MKISERAYTCAIVDDEQIGIEVITEYISMISKLTLNGQYLDPLLAVKDIRQAGNVDFLFLDISMSLSGIHVAELLRENAGFVVFITAHPEYALTAFGVQADTD